jgi:hypothetical protein
VSVKERDGAEVLARWLSVRGTRKLRDENPRTNLDAALSESLLFRHLNTYGKAFL